MRNSANSHSCSVNAYCWSVLDERTKGIIASLRKIARRSIKKLAFHRIVRSLTALSFLMPLASQNVQNSRVRDLGKLIAAEMARNFFIVLEKSFEICEFAFWVFFEADTLSSHKFVFQISKS